MLSLQIAASGMMAQEHRTETVANNLANLNTTAFQRRRLEFKGLISRNLMVSILQAMGVRETKKATIGLQAGLMML